MSFTATTNNIPHYAPRDKVRSHLKATILKPPAPGIPAPSVGAFQEGQHLVDDFKDLFPHLRIQSIFGPQPMWYDPILWDLIDMDGELVYARGDVGKKGAGPPVLTKRYVQWLDLRWRGPAPRGRMRFMNVHAPPSIGVPKQPDGDISRDELHEDLMNANARVITETKTPVMFVGDFNANFNHPNLIPIRKAGMLLANEPGVPTHGNHQIDLILTRDGNPSPPRRKLHVVESGRFPKVLKDDHWGVWAECEFLRV